MRTYIIGSKALIETPHFGLHVPNPDGPVYFTYFTFIGDKAAPDIEGVGNEASHILRDELVGQDII